MPRKKFGTKSTTGKRKKRRFQRVRKCRFCGEKVEFIDYKRVDVLQRYITERGKILTRRVSGNCAKHQRQVAMAVKRARFIALLPYVKESSR